MSIDWQDSGESASLFDQEGQGSRATLTLFELNSLVREVLETTFDHDYWVEAEVSEVREVHGHCYMGRFCGQRQ